MCKCISRWAQWKKLVERLHAACGVPLPDIDGDLSTSMVDFPKFSALVEYLKSCCAQPEFHGMVFVRTRMVRRVLPTLSPLIYAYAQTVCLLWNGTKDALDLKWYHNRIPSFLV